jgi:TRAP transporter TAXI family solute receptor
MKKYLLIVAMLFSATGGAAEVGIASGAPTGTNFPMVEDIVHTCSTTASPINNIRTEGALENIEQIYSNPKSQYGVIFTDALFYQKGIDPKMMDRIQMVFPFFSADFHLIKRKGAKINSLADLQGKRVIEGPQGSGTWVSAQVIKSLTGISWNASNASQSAGLQAVLNGTVDAEFIVAGKPIDMLAKLPDGVELISISHPALDNFKLYTKTMIPGGMYPFQKTSVQTYKVDSVLATYAFKNQYQKEIGDLVTCITKNIGTLQRTGHPKWRDVDPTDINRIDWPSHPAAVSAIKRAMK